MVGSTICFCVQVCVFLAAGLSGLLGQLADHEERLDECGHFCFGLELLIQPLKNTQS